MSNTVNIRLCKFTLVNNDGKEGDSDFGIIISDPISGEVRAMSISENKDGLIENASIEKILGIIGDVDSLSWVSESVYSEGVYFNDKYFSPDEIQNNDRDEIMSILMNGGIQCNEEKVTIEEPKSLIHIDENDLIEILKLYSVSDYNLYTNNPTILDFLVPLDVMLEQTSLDNSLSVLSYIECEGIRKFRLEYGTSTEADQYILIKSDCPYNVEHYNYNKIGL